VKVFYRGKGQFVFVFGMKFLLYLECWPPFWWHGRFEMKPGYLRCGWGLFQIVYMNYSYAKRINK
jgi:hypothetical protein